MCQSIIKRRATLFFLVTCGSIACMILLGIALGTTSWVRAYLTRDITIFNTSQPLRGFLGSNPIEDDDPGAFNGVSFFGLFYGCKKFNYGLGGRKYNCYSVFSEHAAIYNTSMVIVVIIFLIPAAIFALISTIFGLVNILTVPIDTLHGPIGLYIWNLIGVFQEYDGVFSTSYVIVSLVFMISTVIFAGVSLVFGVVNVRTVPIETINGRPGLYLWNGIGLLSGLISTSIFAVLYANELKYESLSEADREDSFATQHVILGYSFWFLVVCDVLFLVNLLLVYITQLIDEPPKFLKRSRTADINVEPPTELREGIMY